MFSECDSLWIETCSLSVIPCGSKRVGMFPECDSFGPTHAGIFSAVLLYKYLRNNIVYFLVGFCELPIDSARNEQYIEAINVYKVYHIIYGRLVCTLPPTALLAGTPWQKQVQILFHTEHSVSVTNEKPLMAFT